MRIFKDEGEGAGCLPATTEALSRIRANLAGVKAVVALGSARGGVGKSALAVNVAHALASGGRKVALLDADLNSPSILPMLGIKPARRMPVAEWLEPIAGPLGLRVISVNLLPDHAVPPISFLEEDVTNGAPLTSPNDNGRSPVPVGYTNALVRLFAETRFGALDLLLVDLAAGLEAFVRFTQIVSNAGLVAVCHPSELSARATAAMLTLATDSHITVLGVIENMAGFSCDSCHTVRPLMPQGSVAAAARAAGVTLLERLPFDPRLAETSDRGTIFVREYPDTPLGKQLVAMANAIDHAAGGLALELAATL
jgi:ATP-binding protein involved in chromosome partitioning